jgi:hypothetical protein
MRKILSAAAVAAAALLAAALPGRADDLTLSLFQNSTNNLFQSSYPEKDQITSLAFSYAKGFEPFSLFTDGGYSYLYENSSISYYTQQLGLDYVLAVSSKTALYFAAKGAGTLYRSEFGDLNYLAFGGVAALKSYLSPSSILKLNYNFDYRDYRWSLFDYLSHLAYFSVDKYFPSRTTLRADLGWGYKYFLHPFPAPEPAVEEPLASDFVATMGYGGGRGYGGGWGGGALPPLETSGPGAGLQMASVSGLVAQGLGERVGIQVSGLRQWTLSGRNPFGSVDEFYLVENPTYDVFSWNGTAASGQLTVEGPWHTQLKIGYTRFDKEFPGIEAMDLDGVSLGVLRRDKRNQAEARLEKNFSAVSLFFAYAYIDNHSNDPLFEWDGHFLTAGFEWNLNWGKGG